MKQNVLIDTLQDCVDKQQDSFEKNLFFKGYVKLGEINFIINNYSIPWHLSYNYQQMVIQSSSNKQNLKIVEEEFCKILERLLRIISIGDNFLEEEILLILTFRFELFLVNQILSLNNVSIENYNCLEIDERIESIKNNKTNTKEFSIAINKMHRNWKTVMKDSAW